MPQVKHTKMPEVADLGWYFGQVVIGQNQGLDFKMLPYFVRHMTEVLLPEVEIHAALKRPMPHFSLRDYVLNVDCGIRMKLQSALGELRDGGILFLTLLPD
jgi:hypothetical protein